MLNSGGFDARTLRELQLLGPYNNKPASDYAQEMEYASLFEYAYITQTGLQSNPDTATITLPDTFKAMKSQHADKWKQAMDQEMGKLKENDVYDLISRADVPFNHRVIGTRCVYKVKSDLRSRQDSWYRDGLSDLALTTEQRSRPYVASKTHVYSWPSARNTTGTSTR